MPSRLDWRRAAATGLIVVLAGGLSWLSWSRSAAAEIVERVVGVVNDEAIFLSQLRRRAAPLLEAVIAQAPEKDRATRIKALYKKLLEQLVDETLIEQTARELQVSVSSLEIDQAIDNVRRTNGLEESEFWQAVTGQGFTRAQYRIDVRKQLLRLKVVNQKVRARVNVSEAQVREEYDNRIRQARRSQRFRAAHILLPLEPGASATVVSSTMSEANALRATLSPETFTAAAEGRVGGDLGWLDQGDLPEALESVLLDLEVGQISPPVRGPSGIHVFWLQERQQMDVQMPSFEDSARMIQQEMTGRAMQRQEAIFLSQLRKGAVIDLRL